MKCTTFLLATAACVATVTAAQAAQVAALVGNDTAVVGQRSRRNEQHVASGKATIRLAELEDLGFDDGSLTKVFAINVNLFWVRDCADEIALLHERVLPGGAVYLFYEANRAELVRNMVQKTSAALAGGGFRVSVVEQKAPAVVGIIGRR